LLFPGTDYAPACLAVERIRQVIESTVIHYSGIPLSVTFSSGLASLTPEQDTFDSILSQADQALYRAKEAGRNQVMVKKPDLLGFSGI
jgi:diguanylate cyclase (GGDEF)-like protein